MAWSAYRTWVAGEKVTAAQLNQDIRDNGNIIAAVGITGWVGFTSTWTSTGTAPALGSGGSAQGYYCQFGKLVVAQAYINLGTTPTVGTGNYRFAIPVTADTNHVGGGDVLLVGSFWHRDASTNDVKAGWPFLATTTTLGAYHEGGASTHFSATTPVVPQSSDRYVWWAGYEAA